MIHTDPTLSAVRLAVDGSPYAEAAARYAALLSRRLALPLYAVHVIDTGLLGGASLGDFGSVGGTWARARSLRPS